MWFSVNELCSKNDSKPRISKPDIDPDRDALNLLKSKQSEIASLRTEVKSLEKVEKGWERIFRYKTKYSRGKTREE